MDLVSIVVPAYNAEMCIERSVHSLLNQTYKNIEVIIVNDGSTDGTLKKCSELRELDSRVKFVSIQNAGVSNARNVAISMCQGKYIAFMDSDDTYQAEYIQNMSSLFLDDVDLVCCGYNVISPQGEMLFSQTPRRGEYSKEKYYEAVNNLQDSKCFNVLWNKVFRRDVIELYNIKMDTSISMGEDLLFVLEYLKSSLGLIVVLEIPEYNYVLSEGGLQASFKKDVELRISQLYELRNYYDSESYPLDGFYMEAVRTYYILMLETNDIRKMKSTFMQTDVYNALVKANMKFPIKFSVFLKLVKLRNAEVVNCAIKLFKLTKRVKHQSYRW